MAKAKTKGAQAKTVQPRKSAAGGGKSEAKSKSPPTITPTARHHEQVIIETLQLYERKLTIPELREEVRRTHRAGTSDEHHNACVNLMLAQDSDPPQEARTLFVRWGCWPAGK